jgi:hypothetical protein
MPNLCGELVDIASNQVFFYDLKLVFMLVVLLLLLYDQSVSIL